ncbi:hypothetical protein GIB67_026746 [Kingdonia uniflora]|uniref:Uncharacterized protein n=1 Tax=Kingdonia uniflora TaxID=39325 RepID=A0A7J7MHM7_9MAGN|nr:hypothetical protein GIB67_026746 [Kingdonia uniflora]
MEFIKVKEVACWVMKKIRPGSLGDPVLNGALSITLNILKHVHLILNLINVLSPPNVIGALHIGHGLTAAIQMYLIQCIYHSLVIVILQIRVKYASIDKAPAKNKEPSKRAATKKPPSTDDEEMKTIPKEKDESNVEFALKVVVNAKGVKKGGRNLLQMLNLR